MSNKVHLLIGSDDVGFQSVNSSKGANLQGLTRVDRAANYFDSLVVNAENRGYALRWNYRVLDSVDHDFKKITPFAAQILLRDIENKTKKIIIIFSFNHDEEIIFSISDK